MHVKYKSIIFCDMTEFLEMYTVKNFLSVNQARGTYFSILNKATFKQRILSSPILSAVVSGREETGDIKDRRNNIKSLITTMIILRFIDKQLMMR